MRPEPKGVHKIKLIDLEEEHIERIGGILDELGVEGEIHHKHTLSYLVDLWSAINKEWGDSASVVSPTYVTFLLPPSIVIALNNTLNSGISAYSELFCQYLPSEKIREWRWKVGEEERVGQV